MSVKHGAYLWLKTGKINPSIRGHRKLQKYLRDLEKDLINDFGGPENLSAAKEILIRTVIEAYGFILLSSMYCKREGILRPDRLKKNVVELQPVLGHQFIAFMNTIRQNLLALGLNPESADRALTPLELSHLVAEEDEEKRNKGKGKK